MKNIIFGILAITLVVASCKTKSEISEKKKSKKPLYEMTFEGQGNEPAWHVDITKDEIFYNSLVNQDGYRFRNIERHEIMDVGGVSYSGSDSYGNSIRVQVTYQQCRDTMEDKIWPCRVSVELNATDGEEMGENGIRGCGEFHEDKRMEGDWMVDTLNGSPVIAVNENKIPTVSFDIEKNRISANMGCNGIGGGYNLMEDKIYIDKNFMSTQMYCEGVMELENSFSKLVVGKTFKMSFIDKQMILTNLEGKEVVVLKRK